MKFIIASLALVAFSHGMLTNEENQDRMEKCGTEDVWTWYGQGTSLTINWETVAVPVSPRHFFTFSSFVLGGTRDHINWRHNGTEVVANCENGNMNLEVPSEILTLFEVAPLSGHSKPEWTALNPVKAWLLNYCDEAVKNTYEFSHLPLLIEVGNNTDVFACLFDANVVVGDEVQAQVVGRYGGLPVTSVNITQLSGLEISSTLLGIPNQAGSILLKEVDNKPVFIGANYRDVLSKDETENLFFFVPYFNNAMCEAGGICEPVPTTTTITTTPEPTTTTPTTTETPEPTTETLTTIETVKPTTETPTTRLPVPKKPSQPKKDEKKKEEEKKEENGNKEIGFELVFVLALYYLWK